MNAHRRGLRAPQRDLGPVTISGLELRLRRPRFDDFEQWRAIRLRDRAAIEPFWVSSPYPWEARHSESQWIRECLTQRRAARHGVTVPFVIEVAGAFAGQCNLSDIDSRDGTAELGIWLSSSLGRHGIGATAACLVLDYAFEQLGLHRVTAPICVDNLAAARSAELIGLRAEATMREAFDAGGRRKDHVLYAVTADQRPAVGFTVNYLSTLADKPFETCEFSETAAPRSDRSHRHLGSAIMTTLRYGAGLANETRSHVFAGTGRLEIASADPRITFRIAPPDRSERRWRRISARPDLPAYEFGVHVDRRPAGRCGIDKIDRFKGTAEVWTALLDDGAAIVVLDALVTTALEVLGLQRVSMAVSPDDSALARAAETIEMVREGRMVGDSLLDGQRVDHDLWAITATERDVHRIGPGS